MKNYTVRILLAALVVSAVLVAVSKYFMVLSIDSVLLITTVFSTNCWLALFPFYKFKKINPFKVFVTGSLIRNLTVGIIICFYYYHYLKNGSGFLISCVFAFAIFQSVEVYQLLKDREIFKTVK